MVDHVVVQHMSEKRSKPKFLILSNLILYSLYTGTMATEEERNPLVDGVSRANVSRDELRDMLRAAVREAIASPPGTCGHSLSHSKKKKKPWSYSPIY